MVNIVNETKLFTPKNISKFAKKRSKLLYAVLGEAIPKTDGEYATIGLALTPDDAFDMCEAAMGDAIEVWVIDGDRGLLSEKWEPQYFKEHFGEVVEYSSPDRKERQPEQEENDEDEFMSAAMEARFGKHIDDSVKGVGIEMPNEVVLGKALLEILECEQFLSKTVSTASYMTGHPIDLDSILDGLHGSIASILKAFATSKGGCEPKFRKKEGIMVPYWTKTQIRQAKLKE